MSKHLLLLVENVSHTDSSSDNVNISTAIPVLQDNTLDRVSENANERLIDYDTSYKENNAFVDERRVFF